MYRKPFLLLIVFAAFGLVLLGGAEVAVKRGRVRAQLEALVRDKWLPFPGYPTSGQALGSSDLFLAELALPQPAQTVSSFAKGLTPNEVLLLVGPEDAPFFTQVAMTIISLNWPHRMQMVRCSKPPALIYPSVEGEVIRRVLFYRMAPPATWAGNARTFGPHLSLVEVTGDAAWNSFCSQ
jgi:hypothetical protein